MAVNTLYRDAVPEDYKAIIRFSNRVFYPEQYTGDESTDGDENSYFPALLPKLYQNIDTAPYHRIALQNGEMVGCLGCFPLPMTVGGEELSVYGLGTMGVSAAHRGEGHMIRLMEDCIRSAEEKGADYMILSGLRQRYEHFGFELGGWNPVFHFDSTNARQLYGRDADFGYTLRPLTEADAEAIDWIYNRRIHSLAYVHLEKKDALRQLRSMGATPMGVFRGEEFCGCFMYRMQMWRGTLDWQLKEPGEIGHILNDFLRWDKEGFNAITAERTDPSDTALLTALSDICEDCQIQHLENIRIFHYEKVIGAYMKVAAALHALADGETVIGFDSGEVLRIAVEGGKPSVTRFDGAPLGTLSGLEAVNLLFGHTSFLPGIRQPGWLDPICRTWFPLPFYLRGADVV